MAAPTKIEFAVQMTCQSCVSAVKKTLLGVKGIESVDVRLDTEQVIVETSLPSTQVKDLIESSGKKAVLLGYGTSGGSPTHRGAAVAIMEAGSSLVKGVIRLVQSDDKTCVVDGTVDGLSPGTHTVCVHQFGDLSQGCLSCGDVLGMGLTDRVKGIVTELKVGEDGQAVFRLDSPDLKVWDLIGRSVVIHKGSAEQVKKSDENKRLVCGIIARSAGLFENSKKFCACDGVTIWQERNVPIAGSGRQQATSS